MFMQPTASAVLAIPKAMAISGMVGAGTGQSSRPAPSKKGFALPRPLTVEGGGSAPPPLMEPKKPFALHDPHAPDAVVINRRELPMRGGGALLVPTDVSYTLGGVIACLARPWGPMRACKAQSMCTALQLRTAGQRAPACLDQWETTGASPFPLTFSPNPPMLRLPSLLIVCREQWAEGKGTDAGGRLVAPVVLDPFLRKHLRDHQVCGGCPVGDHLGDGAFMFAASSLAVLPRFAADITPLLPAARAVCNAGRRGDISLPMRHGPARQPARRHPGRRNGEHAHRWVWRDTLASLGSLERASSAAPQSGMRLNCGPSVNPLLAPTSTSARPTRSLAGPGQDAAGALPHMEPLKAGAGGAPSHPSCSGGHALLPHEQLGRGGEEVAGQRAHASGGAWARG